MIDVDFRRLVSLLFGISPDIRPGRHEDTGIGDVHVRNRGEVFQGDNVQGCEVGPGRHVALLKAYLGAMRSGERLAFYHELQAANNDQATTGGRELGESKANA